VAVQNDLQSSSRLPGFFCSLATFDRARCDLESQPLTPKPLPSVEGIHFAVLIMGKGDSMKLSAICHKCGRITEADYGADPHIFDTSDTDGTNTRRIVKVHCQACGDHERPPHCQPDLKDVAVLGLLVL
jgi:hypothetical protein